MKRPDKSSHGWIICYFVLYVFLISVSPIFTFSSDPTLLQIIIKYNKMSIV